MGRYSDWEQRQLDEIDPDKLPSGAQTARIANLVAQAMKRSDIPIPKVPMLPGRCVDCGRSAAAGCDCDSNRLAIGRGERAKGEREE